MLYLYLEKNYIKLLYLKKTMMGQYETSSFEKHHEADLLASGKVANVDLLASAIKEAVTSLNAGAEKQIFLILPQESFVFMKADVPADIALSALTAFVQDKARSSMHVDLDNYFYDFFLKEVGDHRQVTFYAIEADTLEKYFQALGLLGMKVGTVLPESLALFKLFEKTLRKEKRENIFYVSYSKGELSGYLYDSGGLSSDEKWIHALTGAEMPQAALNAKREELEAKGIKLNRIILSGEESDGVRQDTFTKEVGVWTNPLKRIIPDFYQDYLKLLVVAGGQPFPILSFDEGFGAFVFSEENKGFHILKNPFKQKPSKFSFSFPRIPIFKKEVLIFLVSSILSFFVFVGLSRIDFSNLKAPSFGSLPSAKPSPTAAPVPSDTPTPAVNKEALKIKILNGSGTAGQATVVKDLLKKAGYQEMVTGNADNFDYTQTLIQAKKGQAAAAQAVADDLKDSVANPKIEANLDETEASDIVITIGSDLK